MGKEEKEQIKEKTIEKKSRDQTLEDLQIHLNNILSSVYDNIHLTKNAPERFNKKAIALLGEVAEIAKENKITSEEYKKIDNEIGEKVPEDKRYEFMELARKLRGMIFPRIVLKEKIMGDLNNDLIPIYSRGAELNALNLKRTAEIAKKGKLTPEEYQEIYEQAIKEVPSGKKEIKEKTIKALDLLKKMIFEQEEKEE